MVLTEIAHVCLSPTIPPADQANLFANILAKLFTSVFNRGVDLEVFNELPILRVLFHQRYNGLGEQVMG